MEKLSENKRGRPKGYVRQFVDGLPAYVKPEGGYRTQMNSGYALLFLSALNKIQESEKYKAILGYSEAELRAGIGKFPRGYKTAAQELGRFLEANPSSTDWVLDAVADARGRGISFADIATHFRQKRIGESEGSMLALFQVLALAINKYQRTYPLTTRQQIRAALASLLDEFPEDVEGALSNG